MINKLSKKIHFIISISLLIVVIGIIILFGFLNYNSIINNAMFVMDKFSNEPIIVEKNKNPEPQDNDEIYGVESGSSIDGVYNVLVVDSEVIDDNENLSEEVKEYALEVAKKNKETGIIGNYIYNVRKDREDGTFVMLMENENAITQAKLTLIISIVLSVFSLILINLISRKISKIIVKPVEETFIKQKQFISDASHELKTPLAVIEANTDVLENELPGNKWLKYIQTEVESMNRLVNELLLLTKMENVDNSKNYVEFDLSKEVQIIFSMFESMAYEKNIKFTSNIKNGIYLNGAKEDMEHILSPLIDNAIKHTKKDGEVIVELNKIKNDIIIQVKNMGEPIPEEEREKIFERFYRTDKSRNRNEKRYGLGLAIAKSTVEKYNGKIEVLCKDGFTIFCIDFFV